MEWFKIICVVLDTGVDASGSIVDKVRGSVASVVEEVLEDVIFVLMSGRADDVVVFVVVGIVIVEFAGGVVGNDAVDDVVAGAVFVVDRLAVVTDADFVVEDEVVIDATTIVVEVVDFVVANVVVVGLMVRDVVATGVAVDGVVAAVVEKVDDVVAAGVAFDAVVAKGFVTGLVDNDEVVGEVVTVVVGAVVAEVVVGEAVVVTAVVGADVVVVPVVVVVDEIEDPGVVSLCSTFTSFK